MPRCPDYRGRELVVQEGDHVELVGATRSFLGQSPGHVDVHSVPDRDVVVDAPMQQQFAFDQGADRIGGPCTCDAAGRYGGLQGLSAQFSPFAVRPQLQQACRGQRFPLDRVLRLAARAFRLDPTTMRAAYTDVRAHGLREFGVEFLEADGFREVGGRQKGEQATLVLSDSRDEPRQHLQGAGADRPRGADQFLDLTDLRRAVEPTRGDRALHDRVKASDFGVLDRSAASLGDACRDKSVKLPAVLDETQLAKPALDLAPFVARSRIERSRIGEQVLMQEKSETRGGFLASRGPFREALYIVEVARTSFGDEAFEMAPEFVPNDRHVVNSSPLGDEPLQHLIEAL